MSSPTLTPEQIQMLSSIFRIYIKEVTPETLTNLAPGELSVNYNEGTFYVRNPHTGEIFTPNGVEHLSQLVLKYNASTDKFNADSVNGITFFTSISGIPTLSTNEVSVDTVINTMPHPAIVISPVDLATDTLAQTLNYPSKKGIIEIYKIDQENVKLSYLDTSTFNNYTGHFISSTHLFEKWSIDKSIPSYNATATGTPLNLAVTIEGEIVDLTTITVRLTYGVSVGAKISVNGGPAEDIVANDGSAIAVDIPANTIMMMVRDAANSRWILVDFAGTDASGDVEALTTAVQNLSTSVSNQSTALNSHNQNTTVHITSSERTKLAGVETGANNYVHPVEHPSAMITESDNRRFMTDAEKTKLSALAVHPVSHPATMITEDPTHRFLTDVERSKWNSKAVAFSYKFTISASGWIGTGPYTQTITKANMTLETGTDIAITADMYPPPTCDFQKSSDDASNTILQEAFYGNITGVSTGDNIIVIRCKSTKPTINIPARIYGVANTSSSGT